ncbi:MAG: OsmC family protein [Bacteroidetes bacterium]|nr:OsmC family protein [Bacteroidota bacterium]
MAEITAKLIAGTVVRLTNGRHTWTGDEPIEQQGTDTGPTPYELLLGSLAACTCITLALYARHKDIALRSVTTSYEYKRVHADDCEEWEDIKTGFIDHITTNVVIAGDFDETQRQRLAQVATRCPVHKTLKNGVAFSDKVRFV